MNSWLGLVVMVVLLAVNGFFVGAEFAVTASRRAEIEPLVKAGKRGASAALFAVEHVSEMLATCQLGITLASTGLGVVAEPALTQLLTPVVELTGAPAVTAHAAAVLIALLIVLYLHVVGGEVIPKNLSISAHTTLILFYGPTLVALSKSVAPIVRAMNKVANFFVRLAGKEPRDEVVNTFTVEEMTSIVKKSQAEGTVEDDLGLLSGTLEFSTEQVSGVMVGLKHLVTLPRDVSVSGVEKAVARTGFSRFPVVDKAGRICGYLHIKDVIAVDEARRDEPLESWRIRELTEVSPDMEVEDALRVMQKQGTHLAGVVPRAGMEVSGVIFLEDILEKLVGEVHDSLQRDSEHGAS